MVPNVPFSNGRVAPGPLCLFLPMVNVDALQATGSLSRAVPVLPELHASLLPPEQSISRVEASSVRTTHIPALGKAAPQTTVPPQNCTNLLFKPISSAVIPRTS